MIRVDSVWLAIEPLDMRSGTEAALARVVRVFGAAHPHHAYLFANRRSNRMKVLVHDGIGVWLAVNPIDMRTGVDRLLASVVQVFGAAQAHHGYLFANARFSRIRLLMHDGFGVWCAARRLNKGSFEWPRNLAADAAPLALSKDQFDALVLGLPWQRLEQMRLITRM